MHLGVFGGTGNTGRHLIAQALRNGHEVTVLTRDPGKLPAHPHLHAIAGDIRDEEPVREVVAGAHAVLSMLGECGRTTTVCTDGIRSILHAMRVRRCREPSLESLRPARLEIDEGGHARQGTHGISH